MLLALLTFSMLLLATVGFLVLRRRDKRTETDRRQKICVVTGAASGIGRACCEALTLNGDRCFALDIDRDGLLALQSELGGKLMRTSCTALLCDVTLPSSVMAAVDAVEMEHLRPGEAVDAVLNFAGVMHGGPLLECDDKALERTLQINLLGTCFVNRHFARLLRQKPATASASAVAPPLIVVTASEISLARVSMAFTAPYAMSKFALEAYATALRQELSMLPGPTVRPNVTILNPGPTVTPLVAAQQCG